jgi:hypothetical protein
MEAVQSIALSAGMAWASGLRLYAVLFAAGVLARFGYVELPSSLHVLQHPLVLAASGLMFTIEFFADKIPGVDSLWDAIHTFVRIPAGAVLAALALGNHDPAIVLAAALLGGTLAAGTHAAKAGSRAFINLTPEPVSNIAASLTEEALVAGGLYTAFAHPWVFLLFLAVFIVLLAWLLPRLWRGVRAVVSRITNLR